MFGPVGTVSDELSGDLDVGTAPEEYPEVADSDIPDWNGSIEEFFGYDMGFRSTGGWFARGDCVEYEVTDYDDPLYSGLKGVYTDCGGGDTDLVVVAAAPPGLEFVVLVGVTIATDADFEALDRILATFQTFGDVPGRR